MSHNPNLYTDNSGFNYPSAAGKPTNTDQTNFGTVGSENSSVYQSSSTVPITETHPGLHSYPDLDPNRGKLGGEHGGAGTRADDRKGEVVRNEGDTTSPTAQPIDPK